MAAQSSNIDDFLLDNIDDQLQNFSNWKPIIDPIFQTPVSFHHRQYTPKNNHHHSFINNFNHNDGNDHSASSWTCEENNVAMGDEFMNLEKTFSFSSQMIDIYARSPDQGITARIAFEDLLESTIPFEIATIESFNDKRRRQSSSEVSSFELRERVIPTTPITTTSISQEEISNKNNIVYVAASAAAESPMVKLNKAVQEIVALNPPQPPTKKWPSPMSSTKNKITKIESHVYQSTTSMEEVEREMFSDADCDGVLNLEGITSANNTSQDNTTVRTRDGRLIDPHGFETPNCVIDLESIFASEITVAPSTPMKVAPKNIAVSIKSNNKNKTRSKRPVRKRTRF